MKRLGLTVAIWLLGNLSLRAQQPAALSPVEEKGTYLGVLFGAVSEALYDQLPQLPRNQGVLITHVLPDSPGAHADLHRHDILLQYQQEKIQDCDHFARLIRADKPNHKVKLLLLRGGREITVEVTLGLGPVLHIASASKRSGGNTTEVPRGVSKPGHSAAISVSATPLEQGKMKVAVEYYQEGRLRSLICEGSSAEIDGQLRKLPERERPLVQAALKHIRNRFQQTESGKME